MPAEDQVRRASRALFAFVALLVLASSASVLARRGLGIDNAAGMVAFFDLDAEQSLGTWTSSMLLFSCALVAGFAGSSSPDRRGWVLLAAAFLVMSIDEVGTIHEHVSVEMKHLPFGGALSYPWVLPGVVIVAVFVWVMRSWARRLPERTRTTLVVALAVYTGGAIGLELVEGVLYSAAGDRRTAGTDVLATVQEALELLGISLTLRALALYVVQPSVLMSTDARSA